MMKNRAKLVRGGQQRRDNMLGSVVKEKMQRTEREKKSLLISYIFCWGLVRSGAHWLLLPLEFLILSVRAWQKNSPRVRSLTERTRGWWDRRGWLDKAHRWREMVCAEACYCKWWTRKITSWNQLIALPVLFTHSVLFEVKTEFCFNRKSNWAFLVRLRLPFPTSESEAGPKLELTPASSEKEVPTHKVSCLECLTEKWEMRILP